MTEGAWYEALVTRVLGMSASDWEDPRWTRVFLELSERLQSVEGRGEASGPEDEEGLPMRALVFGQRSFLVGRELGWGQGAAAWLDLGSGTGAAALAAARQGVRRFRLVDRSGPALQLAVRALEAGVEAGVEDGVEVRLLEGDTATVVPEEDEEVSFCFSWNEVPQTAREKWLERALSHPSRRVWIVEPGTKEGFRGLREVRDRWSKRVHAPCRGVPSCPLVAARDWCHFTWNVGWGPAATRILQRARRRAHGVHASYVLLGPSRDSAEDGWRVLEARRQGKTVALRLCGSEGLIGLEMSTRRQRRVAAWSRTGQNHQVVDLEGDWTADRRGIHRPNDDARVVPRETPGDGSL
jgi:hypothetical protein